MLVAAGLESLLLLQGPRRREDIGGPVRADELETDRQTDDEVKKVEKAQQGAFNSFFSGLNCVRSVNQPA